MNSNRNNHYEGNINFTTVLEGTLNNSQMLVKGSGTIDESRGITRGNYDLLNLPNGFPQELLSVMKITGYPNASKSIGKATNPFKGKNYNYRRVINFNGGQMILHASVKRESNNLISHFNITGSFGNPKKLGKILPIRESWKQGEEGIILGDFVASWFDENGEKISAFTNTVYNVCGNLEKEQHRDILINTILDDKKFSLKQDVDLYVS